MISSIRSVFLLCLFFFVQVGLSLTALAVVDGSGSEIILPGSADVTRGTLAGGTFHDLGGSDNVDFSVRRSVSDLQSVVEVLVTGNSINAFPSAIEITIESAVFARSAIDQEIYAYDHYAQEFVLIDVRPASKFFDRVDVASIPGDAWHFVTPAAGTMVLKIRFVSQNKRQQFAANIDQLVWTIYE